MNLSWLAYYPTSWWVLQVRSSWTAGRWRHDSGASHEDCCFWLLFFLVQEVFIVFKQNTIIFSIQDVVCVSISSRQLLQRTTPPWRYEHKTSFLKICPTHHIPSIILKSLLYFSFARSPQLGQPNIAETYFYVNIMLIAFCFSLTHFQ